MKQVVYTVEVDGSGHRRISETVSLASWSPDGSRLALARVQGDDVELITMALDDTDPLEVTRITSGVERFAIRYGSRINVLSWSPDGIISCLNVTRGCALSIWKVVWLVSRL